MFLTVHGAIGIIIGQHVQNPLLAFLAGFISHYIFDIIPHGDTKAPARFHNPIHIGLAAIIDFVILIIFLLVLGNQVQLLKLNSLLAILGALLPDLAQAAYFFFNKKIFSNWQKIHNFFHNTIIADKFDWPFITGICLQIILFILLVYLII